MKAALASSVLLLASCSDSTPAAPGPTESAPPTTETPDAIGPRPADWVQTRVEDARQRMRSDPAGELVWQAIEAHGGLATWLGQSTLEFKFDYRPVDSEERRMHTFNQVDHWSARARQEELDGGAGAQATLGWDGERAWITPTAEAFPVSARFWALTPYYFVAMPFVAADPGTRYERLEDADLDGVTYELVKLTYGEGVGDAPDDYYVLYLHPETRRLAALRYVVSYPGFFPEGGHTPEKLMRYSDPVEVEGLSFAQRLDTAQWNLDDGTPGDVVTRISVSRIGLGRSWPSLHFEPVANAVTTTEIETVSR